MPIAISLGYNFKHMHTKSAQDYFSKSVKPYQTMVFCLCCTHRKRLEKPFYWIKAVLIFHWSKAKYTVLPYIVVIISARTSCPDPSASEPRCHYSWLQLVGALFQMNSRIKARLVDSELHQNRKSCLSNVINLSRGCKTCKYTFKFRYISQRKKRTLINSASESVLSFLDWFFHTLFFIWIDNNHKLGG